MQTRNRGPRRMRRARSAAQPKTKRERGAQGQRLRTGLSSRGREARSGSITYVHSQVGDRLTKALAARRGGSRAPGGVVGPGPTGLSCPARPSAFVQVCTVQPLRTSEPRAATRRLVGLAEFGGVAVGARRAS